MAPLIRGAGKTAPRLIADLLDYDPAHREVRSGKNLLADTAPRYFGSHYLRRGPTDCHHELMKIVDRSVVPNSNDEAYQATTEYVVATYCVKCRYHFNIIADYSNEGGSPCTLLDDQMPMHHLQLFSSVYAKTNPEVLTSTKYNPVIEQHHFVCSQSTCPLRLTIEVSTPRLTKDLLSLFDLPKVQARWRREKNAAPERFQTAGAGEGFPLQSLHYLRQYLMDAKSAAENVPPTPKKIAKRNKLFALAFSNECEALFEYLDFRTIEITGEDPTEEPNYFWQLPTITDKNRDFIDDVITDLSIKMRDRPETEQLGDKKISVTHHTLPALKDIEKTLGYYEYPRRSRHFNVDHEEHPYFASLGALDEFPDGILMWAYDRQRECDPHNKPYYLDCLEDIAKGRKSADLEMKVVMATSSGENGLNAIRRAYDFFNLEPDTREADEHIMGLYKSRIESAPRQKDEAKSSLAIIAKHRESDKIYELANDKAITHAEALEFLGVTADIESDTIEAMAVSMQGDVDISKIARALRVIANERNGDYTLIRQAMLMESGNPGSTLDVGEAYRRLQIANRTAPDETVFTYYQSLMNDAGPGSKDSFMEALKVIALDRQSNFLLTKLDDPNAVVKPTPSTASNPVGLDNIGNTCYLNSLLQYYYTVKPVRNVVMDFQNHRMSLNEEDIKKKRVGGRTVAKSEIIKAQKFVDELHDLFENLKTASTRSVRPTRELAELTLFSSAAEANFRRVSISSPSGPPNMASILDSTPVYGPQLPSPTSRPSPVPVEEDIEMIDHPGEGKTDNDDGSSDVTLVDMSPVPVNSDDNNKDIEMDAKLGNTELIDEDAVMVNGEDAVSETKPLLAPEKQPPLPPRNKSGLVISTNDTKELISYDELWKFGSQQDVTEVIGNVNFRLLCALKATSIDEQSGEQMDIVKNTLYGANAVYLQKAQTLEKKVEAWSNLIVFPAPSGPRDIYEALDVVFDEQVVEIDNTTAAQHASIATLPPIIHIQIQRTAYDSVKQIASKNQNAVNFQETIYLDRYMDTEEPDSLLMRRRRETWKWKAELKTLEVRQAALNETAIGLPMPESLMAQKDYITALQEEEIEGIPIDPSLPDALEQRTVEVAEELDIIDKKIASLKHRLTEQFTDMRQAEYKLQAVFIHRGDAGGGHYWVYIYDFENDIWREYNDEYVTEIKDRRRIFEYQNAVDGTPYYLAYVKSSDKQDLVEAVFRDVPEQPLGIQVTEVTETWESQLADAPPLPQTLTNHDEDMEHETRHIEHVRPRPLLPRPTTNAWDVLSPTTGLDANGKKW